LTTEWSHIYRKYPAQKPDACGIERVTRIADPIAFFFYIRQAAPILFRINRF
jgi:hypothetical protein